MIGDNMKKSIYDIAKNNYVIIIFLSIIVFSLTYILSHEHKSLDGIIDLKKDISSLDEINREEITVMDDEIKEVFEYIIPLEDKFTSYQSIFDKDKVTVDDLNVGDKLYIAYKYLNKTVDFTPYIKETNYDTFKEYYDLMNISHSSYYMNTYITKEHLNDAVKKIFNESLTSYVDFSGVACYIKDNDYVCSNDVYKSNDHTKIDFVKAYKYDDKLEIIVNYRYEIDGVSYKYFNSDEVGGSTYMVTFYKLGDYYYFNSSELYEEN